MCSAIIQYILTTCSIFAPMTIETHPLDPFLPQNGTILFLGSFPPPKNRWCMEFFYPNWINDFWRIMGLLFFQDKHHFEIEGKKAFDKDSIVSFCNTQGFGFYDSATRVCRQMDNASDNYLQVLEHTDIRSLLDRMPCCRQIITTGGKSSEEVASYLGIEATPQIGESIPVSIGEKTYLWGRVPSSSRAYPMSLDRKADEYKRVLKLNSDAH